MRMNIFQRSAINRKTGSYVEELHPQMDGLCSGTSAGKNSKTMT